MITVYFHKEATTTGNGIEFEPVGGDKFGSVKIDISGTATSIDIRFEGFMNNRWLPMNGVDLSDYNIANLSTAKDKRFEMDVAGYNKIRMRVNAISGGNITILGRIY